MITWSYFINSAHLGSCVYSTFHFGSCYCSGRAGREGPGKCFRLYPESEFEKLEDSTKPEIKRCNLSNVVLQLKALGVDDVIGFDFIEKPPRLFPEKSHCFIIYSLVHT